MPFKAIKTIDTAHQPSASLFALWSLQPACVLALVWLLPFRISPAKLFFCRIKPFFTSIWGWQFRSKRIFFCAWEVQWSRIWQFAKLLTRPCPCRCRFGYSFMGFVFSNTGFWCLNTHQTRSKPRQYWGAGFFTYGLTFYFIGVEVSNAWADQNCGLPIACMDKKRHPFKGVLVVLRFTF